jgi:hypothetical protein
MFLAGNALQYRGIARHDAGASVAATVDHVAPATTGRTWPLAAHHGPRS